MSEAGMMRLPLGKLKPLFTRDVNAEGLEELAQTIKFSGILEPLVVRASDNGIVCGYRRYLAAKLAGLTEVLCMLIDCDDAEAFRLSLVENLQRENLSDYEVAKRLREFKDKTGFTDEQIGALIGKSKTWVVRHLEMLKLEGLVPRGTLEKIDEGHARTILSQPKELRVVLLEEVARAIEERGEPPSVREIERRARELLKSPPKPVKGEGFKEVVASEQSANEMVELKTPEDIDRFFSEILGFKAFAGEDVETSACPCGCQWVVEVDWRNRRVEWVAP